MPDRLCSADVIVVGAGIVGATIAYRFASAGACVSVVDAISPAASATRHALGLVVPSLTPRALKPTLDGIAPLQHIAETLGVACQSVEALCVACNDNEAGALRAALKQVPTDIAAWTDDTSLIPAGGVGAAVVRCALQLDVAALTRHMLQAPRINLHAPVEVNALEDMRGRTAIVADGYTATARYIVLATNAFAGLLSPYLADSVSFAQGIAWTSHVAPPSRLPIPIVIADGTFAALQHPDHEQRIQAIAWSHHEHRADPEAHLERWLRPLGVDPIQHMRSRARMVTTTTTDGVPLTGQLGEDGNVLYALGAGLFGTAWAWHMAGQIWQLAAQTA